MEKLSEQELAKVSGGRSLLPIIMPIIVGGETVARAHTRSH